MKPTLKSESQAWLLEMLVYGGLMTGYCLLVFHFLTGWLNRLFHQQRPTYALVALGVIVAQGFLLERITTLLLHFVKKQRAGP